jgi:dihydrofolate reductase
VAPRINSLPKYAFSRSLGSAPWGNYEEAAIKSGDAGQVIRRLKSEIASDLILWGSLSLTYYLFEAGVIDKVRLVVAPVALGSGRGVFPAGSSASRLRLIGNETMGSLVAVDYALEQVL